MQANKGNLMNVSRETGIPYRTLIGIHQGTVVNPGVNTVEHLYQYLIKTAAEAEAAADAA